MDVNPYESPQSDLVKVKPPKYRASWYRVRKKYRSFREYTDNEKIVYTFAVIQLMIICHAMLFYPTALRSEINVSIAMWFICFVFIYTNRKKETPPVDPLE